MNAERFDDAVRRLQEALSRRMALGALLGAVAGTIVGEESEARRLPKRGRKRNTRKGKRKKKKKKKGDSGKKDKKKRKKKGGGGSSGDRCTGSYSEQEILGFIAKAARKYGQSENAMVRVARCESNLDHCAYNRSGPYYGLFQFLKSTWNNTPYGDKNIYDPKAQAMATAWMWKEGRKNEWACK